MNLSDFSLLKETPDHYVVGHPKGKSLTIPKQGLSKKAQEAISKLKKHQNFADGTEEGTENDDESQLEGESIPEKEAQESSTEAIPIDINSVPQLPDKFLAASDTSNQIPVTPEEITPAMAERAAVPQEPALQVTQPPSPSPAPPHTSEVLEGAKSQIQSALNTQKRAGQSESKAYKEAAQKIQELKNPLELEQEFQKKDQALQAAIPSMDANRYMKNLDTGSKIAAGLAFALGGIGSGITGGPNLAVQQINKAIDNDIESQKNDQSKAMNLWKMNRDAYGDAQSANLATQNQLLSVAKVKAMQAAASANSATAQERMAPIIAGFDQKIATNNWMLSRLQGGASGTEQAHINEMNVMQQMNPAAYKEMESKYIPNVGVARIAPSPKQKEEIIGYDSLGKRIDEGIHFQSLVAGGLGTFSGSELDAKAQNIRNSIVVELNKLYGLNRLNEHEYKNFMEQVPNPGSFRTSASLTKLNDLKAQLGDRRDSVYNSLGVTPFKKAPEDVRAIAWAKNNPNDPRAAQIMQLAGR